jgi:hypothetical protein
MAVMNCVEAHDEVEGLEGRDLFDSVCRYYLEMSGTEFLRRWNSGEITQEDAEADFRVSRVVSVLPFAA